MNTPRVVFEKLTLSFSIAMAAVVALAPTIWFVAPENYYFGPRKLLLYFAAIGAFVSAFYFFARESELPLAHGPSKLEYLLRGLAAISFWGFLGLFWLILYGVFYWLARAFSYLTGWVDGPSFAATVGFYVSFCVSVVFAIAIAVGIAQNLSNRLYTIKVTSRITSYNQALREQSKTWIYSGLSIAALVGMGLVIYFGNRSWGYWTYFLLQLVPYSSGAWLLGLGSRVRKDADIVSAVGRLLSAMDYEVVFSPRSSDAAFETLVSGLDIVATKGNHALVIQVKTLSSSSAAVDWTAGSSLRMKAKALEIPLLRERLQIPSLNDKEIIRPLMVLAGRAQDPTLVEFSKEESLPVVEVDMELIEKVLLTDDPVELRVLADKNLQNILVCGDETSTTSEPQGHVKEGQWAY